MPSLTLPQWSGSFGFIRSNFEIGLFLRGRWSRVLLWVDLGAFRRVIFWFELVSLLHSSVGFEAKFHFIRGKWLWTSDWVFGWVRRWKRRLASEIFWILCKLIVEMVGARVLWWLSSSGFGSIEVEIKIRGRGNSSSCLLRGAWYGIRGAMVGWGFSWKARWWWLEFSGVVHGRGMGRATTDRCLISRWVS